MPVVDVKNLEGKTVGQLELVDCNTTTSSVDWPVSEPMVRLPGFQFVWLEVK